MGQATLDLPDPLTEKSIDNSAAGEKGAAGSNSNVNADELLAQLAGDEIDRMLAEAEVERPSEEVGAAAAEDSRDLKGETEVISEAAKSAEQEVSAIEANGINEENVNEASVISQTKGSTASQNAGDVPLENPAATNASAIDPDAQADLTPPAATVEAKGKTGAAATESANPDAAVAAQLDALFTELNKEGEKTAAATSEAAPEAAPETIGKSLSGPAVDTGATANATDKSGESNPRQSADNSSDKAELKSTAPIGGDPSKQTSQLEREVLAADAMEAVDKALEVEPEVKREKIPKPSNSTPIYLRPLVLINLPLANCSDDMRDIIGKIAVTTLINAMALLLYMLLFR